MNEDLQRLLLFNQDYIYINKQYTLVLDLDDTLICASTELNHNYDFKISINNLWNQTYYVSKRPYLDEFLEQVI